MGWDAFAEPRGARNELFENAAAELRKTWSGTVDGLLHDGGLDCSDCGQALENATGRSVYDERPWPPEFVRELAARAIWPEEHDWASVSAKTFLDTCAANGLGIRFSY